MNTIIPNHKEVGLCLGYVDGNLSVMTSDGIALGGVLRFDVNSKQGELSEITLTAVIYHPDKPS